MSLPEYQRIPLEGLVHIESLHVDIDYFRKQMSAEVMRLDEKYHESSAPSFLK